MHVSVALSHHSTGYCCTLCVVLGTYVQFQEVASTFWRLLCTVETAGNGPGATSCAALTSRT
jgi:hypothetical protein